MSFSIDCRTCVVGVGPACNDCVVTFITNREPDEAVVVDAAEFAALRRLASAGLIPSLRHDSGPSSDSDSGEVDEPGRRRGDVRDVG